MKLEVDIDIDELFVRSFTTAGSPNVECNCGRQHICIDSYCYEEPDDIELLNNYKERAETDDKIVLVEGCDHLSVISISGHIFAQDCECKGWEQYRNFVFHNRRAIKQFLIDLSTEAQQALDVEATFNTLKDKSLNVIDEPTF